jgi:hypothetical protein
MITIQYRFKNTYLGNLYYELKFFSKYVGILIYEGNLVGEIIV